MKPREVGSVRRPYGSLTSSAAESADVLMNDYFPEDALTTDRESQWQIRLQFES